LYTHLFLRAFFVGSSFYKTQVSFSSKAHISLALQHANQNLLCLKIFRFSLCCHNCNKISISSKKSFIIYKI